MLGLAHYDLMAGRRIGVLALAAALAVGLVGCGDDATARPQGRTREQPHESVAATPARGSLRPWTASERRYCPLAALAMPMYVQYASQLQGTVDDRATAVTALRQWTRQLREAAPPEISEAVNTLATISDGYYDMVAATNYHFDLLAGAAESAYDVPGAQRGVPRHASYLREHCGITFG